MLPARSGFGGRYRIDGTATVGSLGEVYRGYDLRLARPVAIKPLPTGPSGTPEPLPLARSEARVLASVRHPNLVTALDMGSDAAGAYVVMEYAEGESLASRVSRLGALEVGDVVDTLGGVAAALAELHANGLVHGDVSASNILLGADGIVRLIDSVAPWWTAHSATETSAVGSPPYLAPERLRGQAATAASDVYSLGVATYLAVTGTLPYPSASREQLMAAQAAPPPMPSSIRPDQSSLLDAPIASALGPSASRPTAAAFRVTLSVAFTPVDRRPDLRDVSAVPPPAIDPYAATVVDAAVKELGLTHRWRQRVGAARPRRRFAVIVGSVATILALVAVGADMFDGGMGDASLGVYPGPASQVQPPVVPDPSPTSQPPSRSTPVRRDPRPVAPVVRRPVPIAEKVKSKDHGTSPGHGGTPPGQAKDKGKDKGKDH